MALILGGGSILKTSNIYFILFPIATGNQFEHISFLNQNVLPGVLYSNVNKAVTVILTRLISCSLFCCLINQKNLRNEGYRSNFSVGQQIRYINQILSFNSLKALHTVVFQYIDRRRVLPGKSAVAILIITVFIQIPSYRVSNGCKTGFFSTL